MQKNAASCRLHVELKSGSKGQLHFSDAGNRWNPAILPTGLSQAPWPIYHLGLFFNRAYFRGLKFGPLGFVTLVWGSKTLLLGPYLKVFEAPNQGHKLRGPNL